MRSVLWNHWHIVWLSSKRRTSGSEKMGNIVGDAKKALEEARDAIRRVANGELEYESVAVREGPRTYFITRSERDRRQATCKHLCVPTDGQCSWCTKRL